MTPLFESFIIVAGLSGAGKSTAIDALSDLGFYTIDNLPIPLLTPFIELPHPARGTRAALLLDADSDEEVAQLLELLNQNRERLQPTLFFLDCSTDVILRRYSETRRPHPRFDPARDRSLEDAVRRERAALLPFKERAHFCIDTTALTVHDLKREVNEFAGVISRAPDPRVRVNLMSFGFKYGTPTDCDLLIDVRFMPNPHFVEALRPRTGLDSEVAAYVQEQDAAREFLDRYSGLLEFLLPRYAWEGKSYLTVGIGCTGGRHRSVAIAEALVKRLPGRDYLITVKHRDLTRQG